MASLSSSSLDSSSDIIKLIGEPKAFQSWNFLFSERPDSSKRPSSPLPLHPYAKFIAWAFAHDTFTERTGIDMGLYKDILKQLQTHDTVSDALKTRVNGDLHKVKDNAFNKSLPERYRLPLHFNIYNRALSTLACFFSQKHRYLLENFFPSYESNVNCILDHFSSEKFRALPEDVKLNPEVDNKIKRFSLISIFYVLAIIHEEASKKKGFSDLRKNFCDFILDHLDLAEQLSEGSTSLSPEVLKKSVQKLHVDDGFTWFFLMKLSAFEILTLMTSPALLEHVNKAAEISKIVNDFYSINKDLNQVIHPLKVFRDNLFSPLYSSKYLYHCWKLQEKFNDLQNQRLSLETVHQIVNELSPPLHHEKDGSLQHFLFFGAAILIYNLYNNGYAHSFLFILTLHFLFQKTIEEELIKLNSLYESITQPSKQVKIIDENSNTPTTLSRFIKSIKFDWESKKLTLIASKSKENSYWPKEQTGQDDTYMSQYQLKVLRALKNELWQTNEEEKTLPWAKVIDNWYSSQLKLEKRYGPFYFNHALRPYVLLNLFHFFCSLYLGNFILTSVNTMIHSKDPRSCPINVNTTNQTLSPIP